MVDPYSSEAGVIDTAKPPKLGRERLLSLADVCQMTGWCTATASTFLEESGYKLKLHNRVFILESSLFKYLHQLEEAGADA